MTQKYSQTNKINKILPLKDNIIVSEMNFKERTTSSGIVLLGDDGKSAGIRPRWGRVHAIGPEKGDVQVGQWVLVEHGRWSRGSEVEIDGETLTIRKIDTNAILLVSDQEPQGDDNMSTALQV